MKSVDQKQSLWVEKYRPQTIEDTILPTRIKKIFTEMVAKKELNNMLLSGGAGIGKTTVAKALCNDLNCDYIVINASDERGLDVIRVTIKNFASSVSLEGNQKVVIMDECLEENEHVRIGTVDDWKGIALKDLEFGVKYPVVSFNMETQQFENDIGELISDKEDDLYEVELENGSKVVLNAKHPFIVKTKNGDIMEKTIEDGLEEGDEIVIM